MMRRRRVGGPLRRVFPQRGHPLVKVRIERTWDTVQDRLIPEMRLRQIHRMPAANEYLPTQFLPNCWKPRNTVAPQSFESKYRPIPPQLPHFDLKEIFCVKEFRSVKRNHTLSWDGVLDELTSPFKYSIRGQQIEIRTCPEISWRAFFAGQPLPTPPGQPPSAQLIGEPR